MALVPQTRWEGLAQGVVFVEGGSRSCMRTYTFVYGPESILEAENEQGRWRQISDMRKMQREPSGLLCCGEPLPVRTGEKRQ